MQTLQREVLKPENKEEWLKMRQSNVNSTEISALFGISPYQTEFELFHNFMDRSLDNFQENERTKWGNRLESAIAQGVAEEKNIEIRKMDEYIQLPQVRLGASFDFAIGENGLLEIKNVDSLRFKDTWIIEDDMVEAPPHIELQVQQQLLVSGRSFANIAALIGGNKLVHLEREADPGVHERILEVTADFFKKLETGEAPSPDFVRDSDFISRLYRQSTPGLIVNADTEIENLAAQYAYQAAVKKNAQEEQDAIKARILTMAPDAEKILGQGFSISMGTTKDSFVEAHTRAGYRQFRVNFKKVK
jgi:putative phage-type endonuclease